MIRGVVQSIVVATLIPEQDFSTKIDRTISLMLMGFLIVFTLTMLLKRINTQLRVTGKDLNQKNILIDEQKQHLLSEVHHRVKNNLAVMSALMEIENMMIDDPKTNQVLDLIHSRIMSMSAVHEVLYKSDKLNQIPVQEIMSGIIEYAIKSNSNIKIAYDIQAESVLINVNQALTYALLINEFLDKIKKSNRELKNNITIGISIKSEGDHIITVIGSNQKNEFFLDKHDVGANLIHVLVEQLEATLSKKEGTHGMLWEISFQMNYNKGITSDLNFQ
jgi:two-component sensor histidine kinase